MLISPPTFSDPSQIFLETSRLADGDTRGLGLCAAWPSSDVALGLFLITLVK